MTFGSKGKRYRATAALVLATVTLATGCEASGGSGAAGAAAAASTAASSTATAAPPAPTATSTATVGQVRVAASPALARMASPSATAAATTTTQPAASPASTSPTPPAGDRTVTFANRVSQTIWVAASPDPAEPLAATGWVLPAGQSLTIDVPNKWNGRFWGRTGCVFHNGVGHCETGDCGGLFQCTGYGQIPATLAEYDMDAWDGMDFYDVSMVDGSNLPMYINTTSGATPDKINADGCIAAGCTTPVVCPSALQVKVGGTVVACQSACAAFDTDQYCCRGPYAPRSACDPAKWPVDYAAVFKKAEPYAYSYVDDDATSVYTCSGECDYRITFGVTP
jgi:Thaumatin family